MLTELLFDEVNSRSLTELGASNSAVSADCRVNEGEIDVDEAALTKLEGTVRFCGGKFDHFCNLRFYLICFNSVRVPSQHTLSFTVVLMVASIPMAVEIVTTTSLALVPRSSPTTAPSRLFWRPSRTWQACLSCAPTRPAPR